MCFGSRFCLQVSGKLKFENTARDGESESESEILGFLSGDLVDLNTIRITISHMFSAFSNFLSKESKEKYMICKQPIDASDISLGGMKVLRSFRGFYLKNCFQKDSSQTH